MATKKTFIWSLVLISTLIISSCGNKGNLSQADRESLSQALEKYDNFSDFSEGLSKVSKDDKWGFIDKTGKEIIPCIYTYIYDDYRYEYEGFGVDIRGEESHKMGFVDKMGKEIVPCIYSTVRTSTDFGEDDLVLIIVSTSGYTDTESKEGEYQYYGAFDKTGKEVIPCTYWYNDFKQKIEDVKKEGEYSLNKITIKYPPKEYHPSGLASLSKNGKYGFVNEREKEIIPFVFESANDFSEGLAKVKWNNQEGFVDTEGYFIGKGIVEKVRIAEESKQVTQEIEQTEKVSPKIAETYKYIKGQSFKGEIFSTQHYLSLIKDYLILKFNPKNEFEGNVSIKAVREVNSASENLSGTSGIQSGEYSYYIQEDGNIIIGQIILEKKRIGFQSNIKGIFRGPDGDTEYNVSFN